MIANGGLTSVMSSACWEPSTGKVLSINLSVALIMDARAHLMYDFWLKPIVQGLSASKSSE